VEQVRTAESRNGRTALHPRTEGSPLGGERPNLADWDQLDKQVGGQLIKMQSPLALCAKAPSSPPCTQIFKQLKNPYYLGDEPGLTQTLGWVDAWISQPSVYAVAARTTNDVAAGVNFARA
jgi:hypothetical protein